MDRAILVVDDEPLFRAAVRDALRAASPAVVVREAENASAAAALLDAEEVGVVLADLHMPGGDGFQLLSSVKNRNLNVPIVIVSAHGDAEARRRLRASGALTYFDKPVDLDELVGTLLRLHSAGGGRVFGVSLAGFLQLLEGERRSATIWLHRGEEMGRIDLYQGEVASAALLGVEGYEAAVELVGWSDAILDLQPLGTDSGGHLGATLTELLLESARRADERPAPERLVNTHPLFESDDELSLDWEAPSAPKKEHPMNIEATLKEIMKLDGAIAVALVDYESGMSLGHLTSQSFPIELAAAGNTEVQTAGDARPRAEGEHRGHAHHAQHAVSPHPPDAEVPPALPLRGARPLEVELGALAHQAPGHRG
jgi:DNA-binding NarL/FixJ family response regulator